MEKRRLNYTEIESIENISSVYKNIESLFF